MFNLSSANAFSLIMSKNLSFDRGLSCLNQKYLQTHGKLDMTQMVNLSQTSPVENTVGKGEIARNEQFLLFPTCYLPVLRIFCHFYQILNCRLQTLSVWKSLKFVICE